MMNTRRRLYPRNWEDLAQACKERAGWKCEGCGIAHFTIVISAAGHPYVVYLHAAHVNHDPANPEPVLKALCPTCHARHDYQHKMREARVALERLRHQLLLVRRFDMRQYGG